MVGIRFTMVAQVCSTVAGFCTKKVVSGSPMIFAQIAVIRSVYLADALGLDNRALEGLGGDHGAHADAVSLWYGHSHGL